jgi:hypothetical protein
MPYKRTSSTLSSSLSPLLPFSLQPKDDTTQRPLPDAGPSMLAFLVSRSMRHKFLFSLRYSVIAAQKGTKILREIRNFLALAAH